MRRGEAVRVSGLFGAILPYLAARDVRHHCVIHRITHLTAGRLQVLNLLGGAAPLRIIRLCYQLPFFSGLQVGAEGARVSLIKKFLRKRGAKADVYFYGSHGMPRVCSA
jgi:hypothetical protein